MKKIRSSFLTLILPLSIVILLSYALVASKLGIYWDDWAYIWTRLELGYEGLLRHFSFSRPVAGQLHNIAILITGGKPLSIQIYMMGMQILCAYLFGRLLWTVWNDKRSSWIGALLFAVYPGFTMQPIAVNFSFSYFLIGSLCLSFILGIHAVRSRRGRFGLTIAAILLSLMNLFASEYFFLLELLRPFLFYVEFDRTMAAPRQKAKKVLIAEIPYAAAFAAGLIYRMFFNKTQTLHYSFSLLDKIKTNFAAGIGEWFLDMGRDCLSVLVKAWEQIFSIPQPSVLGTRTFFLYCFVTILAVLVTLFFLFFCCRTDPVQENPRTNRFASLQMIAIGLIALLLAGQPFWLTESYLSFVFPNSRYTLPFILGVGMILAGLFGLLRKIRWIPITLTACLVGLSVGFHFNIANEYRRDWTLTKDFFQQLTWRIPAIKENTVVVTNVLPIRFSTDNSLTAPLNWIYADEYEKDRMPYILYTNTKREKTLSELEPGKEVFQEYLSAQFIGSTDDTVSLYYNAPGCVHVLDPEIDLFNQTIATIDRDAALLTNYDRIESKESVRSLPSQIFGQELAHGWCWYYESADLARQNQDWERVSTLGDEAFAQRDYPNDPMERIPFIEGYAHSDRWNDAAAQTEAALTVTPVMNDPLCALWQRIDSETESSEEKNSTLTAVNTMLDCRFLQEDKQRSN